MREEKRKSELSTLPSSPSGEGDPSGEGEACLSTEIKSGDLKKKAAESEQSETSKTI